MENIKIKAGMLLNKYIPGQLANERWFLAYTQPRSEHVALANLLQQSFDAYLPLYKKVKSTAIGYVINFEAMFPRYIFFKPGHSGQSISAVSSTKGISNIIRFGFEPAYLHDDAINKIRDIEAKRNELPVEELRPLLTGRSVVLKNSALNGLEGVIQSVSSQRVMVLLEILGRPNLISVAHNQVEDIH